MREAGDFHVEARVVHKDYGIRMPGEQVALAVAQVREQFAALAQHFACSHHRAFLVMVHEFASHCGHLFTAPETELRLRVFGRKAFHQIGGVKVAGSLTGNEIVLHRLKPMCCRRLYSSKSVLLMAWGVMAI